MMRRVILTAMLVVLSGCETTPSQPTRQLTPREACFERAQSSELSCMLSAYGGVRNIGSPIVTQRQQACEIHRWKSEDRCLQMYAK